MYLPLELTTLDALVMRSALAALAVALVWILVIGLAVIAEASSQGRVRVARALGCPPRCHRWLLSLATAAMTACALAPSTAVAAPEHARAGSPDGLALPDRPQGEFPVATDPSHPRAREPAAVSRWVTVQPGQSLWKISRSRLPPDAREEQIAALTRALFRHNRGRIGADPDLIRPGEHLAVPPLARETYSEDS